MTDMLSIAESWLEGQRQAHMTQSATYRRGAASLPLAVTIGSTESEDMDTYGRLVRTSARDFVFRAQDLAFGDGQPYPAEGDVVVVGGTRHEVCKMGGLPPWQWDDENRTAIRVHTTERGSES